MTVWKAGLLFSIVSTASCYESTRPPRDDAAIDADVPDDGADSGDDPYDCQAACQRDPPICQPEQFPDGPTCETVCGMYSYEPRECTHGEGRRLIECLERNLGSCEHVPESPCEESWDAWLRCGPG